MRIRSVLNMSVAVGGAAPVEPLPAERARGRGVFHGMACSRLAFFSIFCPFFIDKHVDFIDNLNDFADI